MEHCPLCGQVLAPGEERCARDGLVLRGREDPTLGAVLAGRYRVLGRLARGGMAAVYLARHVLIERVCAVKVLRRDLSEDPVQRDRFLREARAVNRIRHENIVEISDYGESEDGRVFLVMEYLPGESLYQRLRHGAMDPEAAIEIAMQITSGLARAHQSGVVHRDLKPDNVLLVPSDDGRDLVKLLDFGIAKVLDLPALTAHDRIFGTPGYIAPEYAAGAPIDGRADLYSLGVVLYEMATGALPFDAEFQGDLLLKHLLEPPVPPRQRRPELPESVERLILQALAKDPAQRFRDAHHMFDELAAVLAELRGNGDFDPPRASHVPELPAERTSTSPTTESVSIPEPERALGPDGAAAWARYIAAVRRSALGQSRPTRSERDDHVARMELLCAGMREDFEQLGKLKLRTLALEARGRDFRSTIGRALDVLGSELSSRARERDTIAAERDALEQRRAALQTRARAGERRAVGEADALLWQIAASDEVLRTAVAACEDVEFQVQTLDTQLARLSDALEADRDEIGRETDAVLARLSRADASLRALAGTVLAP